MSEPEVTKVVFFVRHGETTSNVAQVVQGLDDPLTERGRLQADTVAARATTLGFERLLSSDAVRAHDTAKAIAAQTGHDVETTPLLREVRRPRSLIGTNRSGEAYQTFRQQEHEHFFDPDWRMEDAENFFDTKTRVAELITFLEEAPERRILCVTHGHILRHIMSYLITGKQHEPAWWLHVAGSIQISNTGVSVFTYQDEAWQLLTWNDHSHFADAE